MTWLLFPFVLPSLVLGHVIGLLTLMFGFTHKPRYRSGILTAQWRPWFAKHWRYSNAIGHFIVINPRRIGNERIWQHELVHIRQHEDNCLLAAIISIVLVVPPNYGLSWIEGLILWGSSGLLWLSPNYFTGWIRFGDAYRGSEHERSAYAQTNNL